MKRVLVISGEQLLLAGVRHILDQEGDLEILSTPISDVVAITQEIELFKPEVIVVEESMPWANSLMMFDLLKAYPELRVVVVSADENRLQVYEKKEILIYQLGDFFSAVGVGKYLKVSSQSLPADFAGA